MESHKFLNPSILQKRYFGYSSAVLIIVVLLCVVIYLVVDKTKRPPPVSEILVEKTCPGCPHCEKPLTYELMSERNSTYSLVSPGALYSLDAFGDVIRLKGRDTIWSVDAPGASVMSLNSKGQVVVKNNKGVIVYETPAQPEGPPYVAYITNTGKLEIMNTNTRAVVFAK